MCAADNLHTFWNGLVPILTNSIGCFWAFNTSQSQNKNNEEEKEPNQRLLNSNVPNRQEVQEHEMQNFSHYLYRTLGHQTLTFYT